MNRLFSKFKQKHIVQSSFNFACWIICLCEENAIHVSCKYSTYLINANQITQATWVSILLLAFRQQSFLTILFWTSCEHILLWYVRLNQPFSLYVRNLGNNKIISLNATLFNSQSNLRQLWVASSLLGLYNAFRDLSFNFITRLEPGIFANCFSLQSLFAYTLELTYYLFYTFYSCLETLQTTMPWRHCHLIYLRIFHHWAICASLTASAQLACRMLTFF